MEPTDYAEVQFDRGMMQWKIMAGTKPLVDERGLPRYWISFSAALDVRDEHNRAWYMREGRGYY
jgi:hypothetical protein